MAERQDVSMTDVSSIRGREKSASPDSERSFFEPYLAWVQHLDYGAPDRRLKRTTRGKFTDIHRPCSIMSDLGQVTARFAEPCLLMAKVVKIAAARFGIEVVNVHDHKRVLVEANADEHFPFQATSIYTAFKDVPGAVFTVEDYPYDSITFKGVSYVIPGTDVVVDSFTPTIPPLPLSVYIDKAVAMGQIPETPASNRAVTATSLVRTQPAEEQDQIEELNRKNLLLQNELVRLNAQLVLSKIENSLVKEEVQSLSQKKTTAPFSIQNYTLRKSISRSINGHLYGVEHTSGKHHVLKEIIDIHGDSLNDLKHTTLSNELAVASKLMEHNKAQRTATLVHLLMPENTFVEHTPLRTSYYILCEPAAFSLEEFTTTNLRNCDSTVPYIIGAQILMGLQHLISTTGRVHGNLTFENVFIDFMGNVKLSSFDFSFPIGDSIHPSILLADPSALQYKHTHILDACALSQHIQIRETMDIWSVGCIMYRLLTDNELFGGLRTPADRVGVMESTVTEQLKSSVGDLLCAYESGITVDKVLTENQAFAGVADELITSHFSRA